MVSLQLVLWTDFALWRLNFQTAQSSAIHLVSQLENVKRTFVMDH